MEQSDLISVVITSYMRKVDEIKKAVQSVIKQTYKNLEIIIVDDSPNCYEFRDEVKKFCISLDDSRIVYIQHERNMGACAARNTGIGYSHGKYISFLDDDDEYLESRIEKMVGIIRNSSKVVLVYCNANIIDGENLKLLGSAFDGNKQYRGNILDKIMGGNFIGSTSIGLVSSEAMRCINGFDPLLVASQDWDVWIRLSEIGLVDYIDEPLVNYYIHSGVRISNNIDRRIEGLKYLNQKNLGYLSTHSDALVQRLRFELRLNALAGNIMNAWKNYLAIWKTQPTRIIENIGAAKSFGRLILKKSE